jgi:hypothetical protein
MTDREAREILLRDASERVMAWVEAVDSWRTGPIPGDQGDG